MSILFAVVAVSLLLLFARERKQAWSSDERLNALKELTSIKTRLQAEIFARIYLTRSVAAYVSFNPDLSDAEFATLAAELIRKDPVVNTMTIAPGGVIRAVFPLEGHEEAVGLDLMAHPDRRKIVEKTIRTENTFFAGPVELVEGGKAFISYTPVFDKTGDEPEFWGVTDISLRFEPLMHEAGLTSEENGIALRGKDGLGEEGDLFWGKEDAFERDSVRVEVSLPDGYWVLARKLDLGWMRFLGEARAVLLPASLATLLLIVLMGLLIVSVFRIRASRQRLEQLNRDKDQLISIISHDVRSPLSGAIGLLSEMETSGDRFSEEDRESVSMTHGAVEEAMLLLDNLLEWVKSRDSQPFMTEETISLDQEVAGALESFSLAAARKGIPLVNRVEAETQVRFDRRAFRVILRNLIGNGIKFSREGGELIVSAREESENRIEIAVTDRGVGMSEEKISEIQASDSVESSQGTAAEQGTGLGLVLCRKLLVAGGSDICIESEKGKGTTIRFQLPRSSP